MVDNVIIIESSQHLRKVDLTELPYMYYLDGIVTIELVNGDKLLCCLALKELEGKLSTHFVRINRNTIINIDFLSAYYKNSQKVMMHNGRSFIVSRRNIPALIRTMKEYYTVVKS